MYNTRKVVVDSCQLRSEASDIRTYASLGFLTLVTGSKFFCGPPFCGAVLLPPKALAEIEAGKEHLPSGFEDYLTQHEVRMLSVPQLLPSTLFECFRQENVASRREQRFPLRQIALFFSWNSILKERRDFLAYEISVEKANN